MAHICSCGLIFSHFVAIFCRVPPCVVIRLSTNSFVSLFCYKMDYPQDCPPQDCPLVGNSEVGNPEYTSHQDCPPQLSCCLCIVCEWYGHWVNAGDLDCEFHYNKKICNCLYFFMFHIFFKGAGNTHFLKHYYKWREYEVDNVPSGTSCLIYQ